MPAHPTTGSHGERRRSGGSRSAEKWAPFGERSWRRQDDVRRSGPARLHGLSQEVHPRFFGRALALSQVACAARDDEVVPGVASASRARQDVIDVELADARLLAAVL